MISVVKVGGCGRVKQVRGGQGSNDLGSHIALGSHIVVVSCV